MKTRRTTEQRRLKATDALGREELHAQEGVISEADWKWISDSMDTLWEKSIIDAEHITWYIKLMDPEKGKLLDVPTEFIENIKTQISSREKENNVSSAAAEAYSYLYVLDPELRAIRAPSKEALDSFRDVYEGFLDGHRAFGWNEDVILTKIQHFLIAFPEQIKQIQLPAQVQTEMEVVYEDPKGTTSDRAKACATIRLLDPDRAATYTLPPDLLAHIDERLDELRQQPDREFIRHYIELLFYKAILSAKSVRITDDGELKLEMDPPPMEQSQPLPQRPQV